MIGAPDTVAKVGHLTIKNSEYQNEFNRQLSLYRNFTQNKDLTAQQIKQFRIKENAINNLVEHRLWVKLAQENDLGVSEKEVIDKIKEQTWFLTDKKFDFDKYKYLLQSNGMTTSYFENLMGQDVLNSLSRKIFSHYPVSSAYIGKLNHFKNQKVSAHIVEIPKNSLQKHLKVSKKEINRFLKEPENLEKVKAMFEKRKAKKSASKKSKFDRQKYSLSRELIQKSPEKEKDLKDLQRQFVKKFQFALKGNKMKRAKSLTKKYELKMDKNIALDRFNGSKGTIKISENDLKTIFKGEKQKSTMHLFQSGDTMIVVKVFPFKESKKKAKEKKKGTKGPTPEEKQKNDQKMAQGSFQRKLSRSIIDKLKKDVSVKIYDQLL